MVIKQVTFRMSMYVLDLRWYRGHACGSFRVGPRASQRRSSAGSGAADDLLAAQAVYDRPMRSYERDPSLLEP